MGLTRSIARMSTGAQLILLLLIFAFLYVVGWLVTAWWLMLAVGVVHHDWIHNLALLGWKGAVPVAFFLSAIGIIGFGVFGASRSK